MKKILTILTLLMAVFAGYADDKPSFPGGDAALADYLKKNVHYPQVAQDNGVEGIVTVGFVVMPDGSLQQVKIVHFVDPDLEKEAIRVVTSMPAWIPAEKDGTPVEAPAKVEVSFLLD